jgi:hypothetical protein
MSQASDHTEKKILVKNEDLKTKLEWKKFNVLSSYIKTFEEEINSYEKDLKDINQFLQNRFLKNSYEYTKSNSYWKSYANAYTDFQANNETINLKKNMVDSNNRYIWSYQTDTMKYLWNIISANWSLNSQNLSKQISEKWIKTKILNYDKMLWWTFFTKNWYVSSWYVSQRNILNEWTKTTSLKLLISKIIEVWNNSNVKISWSTSILNTTFANWNKFKEGWASAEAIFYKWFNKDESWNINHKWVYWSFVTVWAINVLWVLDNFWRNIETTWAITWQLWYKWDKINSYIESSISWDIQNMSSIANTGWIGILDWYSMWAGLYYKTLIWTFWFDLDYDTYRWNNSNKVWIGYSNWNLNFAIEHEEGDTDFKNVDTSSTNRIKLWITTNENWTFELSLKKKDIFTNAGKIEETTIVKASVNLNL